MTETLSDIFKAVASKELKAVDILGRSSNQHEVTSLTAIKNFFEGRDTKGELEWLYFSDNSDPSRMPSSYHYYDARLKSFKRTGRTEWRLYYQNFLSEADVGDVLFLVRTIDDQIFGLIFRNNSEILESAIALFGVTETGSARIETGTALKKKQLTLARKVILDALGLSVPIPVVDADADLVIREFKGIFPTTRIMSNFARTQIEVDFQDSDDALVRWINREEQLFRAMEKLEVEGHLKKGFRDVDEFISYSLSVHQRRKSRMGFALMHHLEQLFTLHKIKYSREKITEKKNKPDFLFPGIDQYRKQTFSPAQLTFLGAKSTCKDRWRQILPEAVRIPHKHLCTLEAGISKDQTDQMKSERVILVLPAEIRKTYSPNQQKEILTLKQFIELVRSKQH